MSELLTRIFTGGVSPERVHPAGAALMAAAVVLAAVSGPVSGRWPEEKRQSVKNVVKVIATIICAAGALIAILGK